MSGIYTSRNEWFIKIIKNLGRMITTILTIQLLTILYQMIMTILTTKLLTILYQMIITILTIKLLTILINHSCQWYIYISKEMSGLLRLSKTCTGCLWQSGQYFRVCFGQMEFGVKRRCWQPNWPWPESLVSPHLRQFWAVGILNGGLPNGAYNFKQQAWKVEGFNYLISALKVD
jgi:hypothetical protein